MNKFDYKRKTPNKPLIKKRFDSGEEPPKLYMEVWSKKSDQEKPLTSDESNEEDDNEEKQEVSTISAKEIAS